MPKAQSLPVGTLLDSGQFQYKIERVLGAGSYGITYLASAQIKIANVTSRVRFAIKELFLDSCFRDERNSTVRVTDHDKTYFEEAKADFLNEARRLVALCKHTPYIVNVNESFEANGTAYFVMEYLEGGPVGRMPEAEALKMIAKVAAGLQVIHKAGLLHLDIKPDNVILACDNYGNPQPVIIDFGIAKHFDSDGKPTSRIDAKGATKGYAPMEQYSGIANFSPKYDVYALGALLFYMLTGQNPPDAFELGTNRSMLAAALPPDVSERTKSAILHAMSPSAFERTPDTATFLAELGCGVATPASQPAVVSSSSQPMPHVKTNSAAEVLLPYQAAPTATEPIHANQMPDYPSAGNNRKKLVIMGAVACVAVIAVVLLLLNRNNDAERPVLPVEDRNAPLTFDVRGIKFKMIPVEGGQFMMGAKGGSAYSDESPIHEVTISDFMIAETEVTQALWSTLVSTNPSYFGGSDHPVDNVSWQDAQVFIDALNRETGENFRLPTEAEWEYAAKGGNLSRGYVYSGSDNAHDVGWTSTDSRNTTHSVKSKAPNELGLYDMTGNVWEWCSDIYGRYDDLNQIDPTGPAGGAERVARGGSWNNDDRMARTTNRGQNKPTARANRIGFRLALDR